MFYVFEFNISYPNKVIKSNSVYGFEEANDMAMKTKAMKFRYPIMHATIGKLHGLILLVISSIFKHDYLSLHTS